MNIALRQDFALTDTELRQAALAVPIELLRWPAMAERGIEVLVRRDDLVHPQLSGNKFYKLFYNLQAARASGYRRVLSWGGAYSNHLHALAAAGQEFGFETIGIVRGEGPAKLSSTLADAERWGMRLHFVPRSVYGKETDVQINQLRERFGDFYALPEGGANCLGGLGTQVMGWALEQQLQGAYCEVCLPCGTGSTLAGVSSGLPAGKTAVGFSVLKGTGKGKGKGTGDLGANVSQTARFLSRPNQSVGSWRLISGFHGGGYGRKLPDKLKKFWHRFEADTGLLLDPVYTLKMFWGMEQLAHRGYWPRTTRLIAIHTGGLQGRRGFYRQTPEFLSAESA